MFDTFKRLLLGVGLIALAAGVLLYTDRGSRHASRAQPAAGKAADKVIQVALVQHASIPPLDDGVVGILAALAERGYKDGGRLQIKRYNA